MLSHYTKKYGVFVLSVCLVGGMLGGCGKKEASTMTTAIHVDTQKVTAGTLELTSDYIGTISPNDSVDVTPMVAGTVTKVNVAVGDTVNEGDVLCQFDDTAAQFSVENANNSLDSAKAGKDSAASQQDLAAEQTKSSLATLKTTLSSYEKSRKTAKSQLGKLKKSKSSMESSMEKAKTAYTTSKTMYKTAENLYVNYKAFLNTYPDCQTTAGLSLAMSAVGTSPSEGDPSGNGAAQEEKAKTAASLMNTLTQAGVTVEYLSDAGLNTLKENASDAEAAYTAASSAYGEATSGITTLENSIDSLDAQISATKKSISAAEKAQSITQGEVSDNADEVYDTQINAAQIGVDSAEYQKELYTITAPMSGIVESVNVSENEMAAQGMPAFTISGKRTMLVTFYVTEEVKNFLQDGDSVSVENQGETYRGNISSIATAVDSAKGLFKVEAQIYVNSETDLSTGVSVSLSVISAAEKNEILVPYDAVYYDNNQAYVYCVKDGKASRVDVKTGLYDEDTIAVESGLSQGDEVVVSWASGLKNGAEIAEDSVEEDSENEGAKTNSQSKSKSK